MDEYITTRRNVKNTIRDELETTFKDCDCVEIPWVMMSFNSIEKNPESLLKTNTYRWNHDMKHPTKHGYKFRCMYELIPVKSIFKPCKFNKINCHRPLQPITAQVKIVDSIDNLKMTPVNDGYPNLREEKIARAYLVCYHYRIVSLQHYLYKKKHKIWHNFTMEAVKSCDYPEIVDETLKNKSSIKV
jgi:hypothetical protein